MNTKRRASATLVLLGLLQATLGTVVTLAVNKGFGVPLFWSSTFSLACAWVAERRASVS
ncbi:hypothetical protein [Streptomyces sp. NPDC053431]|uniref:hypothetical protein n=1 Tax=Streptomyces sp. NPDC053431 TaxID=3365703 RepID=UPI0037D97277